MTVLYFAFFRNLPSNSGVDVRTITWYTIHNPLWWAGLAVCLAFGFAIVRSWPVPPILWVAVLVTGLVPAGFLALFIVLVVKLNSLPKS